MYIVVWGEINQLEPCLEVIKWDIDDKNKNS